MIHRNSELPVLDIGGSGKRRYRFSNRDSQIDTDTQEETDLSNPDAALFSVSGLLLCR